MVDPVPSVAPLTPLSTTVHAYVAPVALEVKAILVADPVQIVCEAGVAMAVGIGFTVTTTSTIVPGQLLIHGVT